MKHESYDTNRDMAREAKLGKYWCYGCDANLIGDGEKCIRCGWKPIKRKRRYKKSYE